MGVTLRNSTPEIGSLGLARTVRGGVIWRKEKLLTAEIAEESQRTRRKASSARGAHFPDYRVGTRRQQDQRRRAGVPVPHGGPFHKKCPFATFAHLLGKEVVEGFYGGEFVVFDVEDSVELGDVEDVVNFL